MGRVWNPWKHMGNKRKEWGGEYFRRMIGFWQIGVAKSGTGLWSKSSVTVLKADQLNFTKWVCLFFFFWSMQTDNCTKPTGNHQLGVIGKARPPMVITPSTFSLMVSDAAVLFFFLILFCLHLHCECNFFSLKRIFSGLQHKLLHISNKWCFHFRHFSSYFLF